MRKRLLLSVFAALAIAGSFHVSVAAAPPEFLVCRLEDGTELQLLIENFGGQWLYRLAAGLSLAAAVGFYLTHIWEERGELPRRFRRVKILG